MMTNLEIPLPEQIDAMVRGTIVDLIRRYVPNVNSYDFRRYLTVRRADLETYLKEHPSLAASRLATESSDPMIDESTIVEATDEGYQVSTIDHGRRDFVRRFRTVHEAVAEQILRQHGMY
jgi:hypothetical protein